MSNLLYDYTQELIPKLSSSDIIDREIVIKRESGGDLSLGTKARIVERKDNNRYLVIGLGGRYSGGKYTATKAEMEFIPITAEEFDIALKELDEKAEEFKERVECIKELGIEQVTKSSFIAWKILKACNEEKDQEKLKKIIVDSVSAIADKGKSE